MADNDMSFADAVELSRMIGELGVNEVIEQIGMACRELADGFDDENDEETARKWRVRGNGVMQALRLYKAFVEERNAG